MRWGTADGAAFRPTFSPQSSAYSSPFTCYLLCLPTTIKNNLCGTPPSREIAAVAMLPRKDSLLSKSIVQRDISLALNMTYFFICLCEGSEATKQTPGRVEVYGV